MAPQTSTEPPITGTTAATAVARPLSPRLKAKVLAAQASMVFERSRLSNLLGLPFGLLICWVLWDKVDQTLLLGWLAAKVLVCIWRVGIDVAQRRAGPAEAGRWLGHYQTAHVADGLVYGGASTWLVADPASPIGVLMSAAVIGTASVGFVVLSQHYRTLLCFVLPLLVPMMVWQLWLGTETSLFVGIGSALFLVLMLIDGWRASGHTEATLRLRYRMNELADQRQQAMELAQQHSAVKGRFLATMSHEMRTPLHGMLGMAQQLRGARLSSAAEFEKRLATIEQAGEQLLSLINDVLDFSTLETGQLQVASGSFDLSALLAEVAEWTRISADSKQLQFELDSQLPQPCWVRGDAARLRQVLMNLCGNALKFTDHGGIRLQLSRLDGRATFDVIDSGCGFPAEHAERLFEAFHQEDTSNMRRHGGTGLGLAISRELARLMGGDLSAQGQAGLGAQFTLTLPLPDGEPPMPPPVAPAPPPALRGRVLVVEDNPINAMVAEAMLARAGLGVDTVTDGHQAVQRTLAEHFDVVLMDCQMPVLDGIEATRQIRQREAGSGAAPLPIVGLTANATEEDRQACLAAGMDDYLSKPFREHQLHDVLARYLVTA